MRPVGAGERDRPDRLDSCDACVRASATPIATWWCAIRLPVSAFAAADLACGPERKSRSLRVQWRPADRVVS